MPQIDRIDNFTVNRLCKELDGIEALLISHKSFIMAEASREGVDPIWLFKRLNATAYESKRIGVALVGFNNGLKRGAEHFYQRAIHYIQTVPYGKNLRFAEAEESFKKAAKVTESEEKKQKVNSNHRMSVAYRLMADLTGVFIDINDAQYWRYY